MPNTQPEYLLQPSLNISGRSNIPVTPEQDSDAQNQSQLVRDAQTVKEPGKTTSMPVSNTRPPYEVDHGDSIYHLSL